MSDVTPGSMRREADRMVALMATLPLGMQLAKNPREAERMTWCVTKLDEVREEGDGAHIHPSYELHTISPDCFCQPKLLDEVEVYPLWLHRDKLDREGPSLDG